MTDNDNTPLLLWPVPVTWVETLGYTQLTGRSSLCDHFTSSSVIPETLMPQ